MEVRGRTSAGKTSSSQPGKGSEKVYLSRPERKSRFELEAARSSAAGIGECGRLLRAFTQKQDTVK